MEEVYDDEEEEALMAGLTMTVPMEVEPADKAVKSDNLAIP